MQTVSLDPIDRKILDLLQQLNAVMRAVDLTRMQMALNVAYVTEDEVALSSAAMPPAFLYRAGREVAEEILVPGLPLGAMADTEYDLVVFDRLAPAEQKGLQQLERDPSFYGVLRPLDLIQPYRLEMGTRLDTDRGKALHRALAEPS